MKNLKAKLRRDGGFTLVEMLIVVAIIAILVAVSMPMINNALEKTKHATDEANERAAKAEMVIQYLADDEAVVYNGTTAQAPGKLTTNQIYYYDAANGYLNTTAPTVTYGQHNSHKYLALKVDANGLVSMEWDASTADAIKNGNLCGNQASSSHS